MKNFFFFTIVTLMVACQSQPSTQGQSPEQAPADLASLKSSLRDAIKTQLPMTKLDKAGELPHQRAYSFDIEPSDDGSTIRWVFPEKHYDLESSELIGGGKFILVFDYIDLSSIQRGFSPDSTRQSIVIKPKADASFAYEPFSNEPYRVLQTVELGWWDRAQDASVDRVLALMGQVGNFMLKHPVQLKGK